MSKIEKLRFWASVLEKPYKDLGGQEHKAVEANLLAAEAMRFMADKIEVAP